MNETFGRIADFSALQFLRTGGRSKGRGSQVVSKSRRSSRDQATQACKLCSARIYSSRRIGSIGGGYGISAWIHPGSDVHSTTQTCIRQQHKRAFDNNAHVHSTTTQTCIRQRHTRASDDADTTAMHCTLGLNYSRANLYKQCIAAHAMHARM